MGTELHGSCLCGSIRYKVEDRFSMFFMCHCTQCRKLSGSSNAANLFGSPDSLTWLSGADQTTRYQLDGRAFTKVFCAQCGTAMPYVSGNGKFLVVPAGSLDDEPTKTPDARIYCSEQAEWHKRGLMAPARERI